MKWIAESGDTVGCYPELCVVCKNKTAAIVTVIEHFGDDYQRGMLADLKRSGRWDGPGSSLEYAQVYPISDAELEDMDREAIREYELD